jgi:hypothetical protein
MGYHLTVLRTRGDQQLPISKQEFAAATRTVPELTLEDTGDAARYERDGELRAMLFWNDGEIWTKVPEDDVIVVLLALAEKLKARVRGDELETYRSPGDSYTHPDDAAAVTGVDRRVEQVLRRRRVWSRVRTLATLTAAALALAYLALVLVNMARSAARSAPPNTPGPQQADRH